LSNVRIAGQKRGAQRPPRFASLLPAAPPAGPTAPSPRAPVGSWSRVVVVSSIEVVQPPPASPPRVTNPADLVDVGNVLRMRQAVRHCRGRARRRGAIALCICTRVVVKEPPTRRPLFLWQDALIETGLPNLFRADLHCLHARFCFGSGFEGTVVYNGRGRCGRLRIHNRALFGGWHRAQRNTRPRSPFERRE